ncbi:unnamed protein product [Urochloa decumbens]|uniref:Uncharacterized protein n=1 Tax=Urochloa decumbens TaxID=240449 RepID=A0ABC9E043_9POAL
MVIERHPPDWMPTFPTNNHARRSHHPSASAPSNRASRHSSSRSEGGNESSEDDGSSSTSVMSRCSPKAVYLVVSKFSEYKKECVREMGFDGILDLPCISKVNLKFSSWLLSKLDTEESSLVISENRRIYVHEKDVGIVFGIPCGDLDIASTDITEEQIEHIRGQCCLSGTRSFRSLEHVLAKHIDDRSSKHEVHRFKVAFVIFVMGHLLAPSAKHDCGRIDFWGALKDPELIHRFNWCRFVHTLVLESAQRARAEMIAKGRVTSLSGCHLFIQILFLDNIDLRGLSKSHNNLPRIKAFDQESIRWMTTSCASRGEQDFACFVGIRPRALSAYMRHTYESDNPPSLHVPASPRPEYIEVPLIPYTDALGSCRMIAPDSYPFRDPSDFSAYVKAKYPCLEKHYVFDYFKLQNACMIREIAKLRCAVIKRNAQFVDWFVQNVGMQNILRMHKKPRQGSNMQSSTSDVPGCSGSKDVDNGDLAGLHIRTEASVFGHGTESASHGTHGTKLGKRPIEYNDTEQEGKKRTVTADVPSFDLGISFTPAPDSFETPKDQRISQQKSRSVVGFALSSPDGDQHSSNTDKCSPRSATVQRCSTIVYEQLALLEDASSQPVDVMYAQAVREPYQKAHVEQGHEPNRTSFSAQRHQKPNQELVDMLHVWMGQQMNIDDTSLWVLHQYPRMLTISAAAIKENYKDDKLFDDDVVDGIIRRFNQLDLTIGEGPSATRWRHFLESDFATLSLGGQIVHDHNQFCTSSSMLITPCRVARWLSPQCLSTTYGAKDAHMYIQSKLLASLAGCFDAYYDNWVLPVKEPWSVEYPKMCDESIDSADSGICMLQLARYYNGADLEMDIDKEAISSARHELIFELLSIKQNCADIPTMLDRIIK